MALFDANSISPPTFGQPASSTPDVATLGLQQQVGAATTKQVETLGPGQVSQAKAAIKGQQLNQNLQQKAQSAEYKKQRGQLNIHASTTQQRAKLAKQRNIIQQKSARQRQQLSSMGRDLEDKLFNQRMEFTYDQRGIRFKHMRQLADFKKMVAKDDEEYADFAQKLTQRHTEKAKILQIAHAKIAQKLNQAQKSRKASKDHEAIKQLAEAKRALEAKIKKEQAKAKNTMMIVQGAGMAAGAVAGGPAGAMVGGGLATSIFAAGTAAT